MIELFLAILAIVSVAILGVIGFVWSIIRALLNGLTKYFLKIAISFDKTGNVICGYMLNDLLCKPNGYRFGNENETVSLVLGINHYHYDESRLYWLGKVIVKFLHILDKGHARKAYLNWLNK